MFDELTEEMLDLSATVRGYGAAPYANVDTGGASSSSSNGCTTIILCVHICW